MDDMGHNGLEMAFMRKFVSISAHTNTLSEHTIIEYLNQNPCDGSANTLLDGPGFDQSSMLIAFEVHQVVPVNN